jgi:hypothetical protein
VGQELSLLFDVAMQVGEPLSVFLDAELEPGPTCWERNVPPGARTRAISVQTVTTGWRLATSWKLAERNGSPPPSSARTTLAE